MTQDSSENNEKKATSSLLNLGLSEFLSPPAVESKISGEIPPVLNQEAPQDKLSTAETEKAKSAYELLAERGEWEALAARAEPKIHSDGKEDSEAKLYWIMAQLRSGSVPLSILTAPLQSVGRAVLDEKRAELVENDPIQSEKLKSIESTCAALSREVGGLLIDKGEFADSVTLTERAYQLDGKGLEELRSCIRKEREHLKNSKDYSEEFLRAARLRDLENIEAALPRDEASIDQASSAVPNSSSWELSSKKEAPNQGADVTARSSLDFIPPNPSRVPVRGIVALIVLVVIGGTGFLLGERMFGSERSIEGALPSSIALQEAAKLELPQSQRLGRVNHLDALYYEMEKEGANRVPLVAGSAAPPQNSPVRIMGTAGGAEFVPKEATAGERQVVDTNGPIEQNLPATDIEKRADDARAPLFDRTALPTPQSSPRGVMVDTGDARVEALPVENYSGGRSFVIIARTRVVSRPTFRSATVATLQVDDVVLVEARVGDWLRLRSKRGEPGYIFAQDAIEKNLRR